jgi:hypothetical protein
MGLVLFRLRLPKVDVGANQPLVRREANIFPEHFEETL